MKVIAQLSDSELEHQTLVDTHNLLLLQNRKSWSELDDCLHQGIELRILYLLERHPLTPSHFRSVYLARLRYLAQLITRCPHQHRHQHQHLRPVP